MIFNRLIRYLTQLAHTKFTDEEACCREYLRYARQLSFYGSAFFYGTCSQKGLLKTTTVPITVALNRFGITFFKTEADEMLAHLTYAEMAWDVKEDESENDPDANPDAGPVMKFVVEYDGGGGPRQIEVESPQARYMDAMAQSCLSFVRECGGRAGTLEKGDRGKLNSISYSAVGSMA